MRRFKKIKFMIGILFYFILLVTDSVYGGDFMNQKEIIQCFENFFDEMNPGDVNNNECFAWFSGFPNYNIVTHLYCERNDLGKKVDELIEKAPKIFFPSFWVYPENRNDVLLETLIQRGYKSISSMPIMVWHVIEIKEKPNHKILLANAENSIFWQIINNAFQMKDCEKIFPSLFHHRQVENYLVYLDDKPVGAGTLFVDRNIGVISNVATLSEYQKRGCGRSMMLFLMKRAYELGLKDLILGASPASKKLYFDIGFEKQFDIEVYAR